LRCEKGKPFVSLEALGQCTLPPRHILPSPQCRDPDPDPYPYNTRIRIRDTDPQQNLVICLFIGPLPTVPENFMEMRSEIFVQSCWQSTRQTSIYVLKRTADVTRPLSQQFVFLCR